MSIVNSTYLRTVKFVRFFHFHVAQNIKNKIVTNLEHRSHSSVLQPVSSMYSSMSICLAICMLQVSESAITTLRTTLHEYISVDDKQRRSPLFPLTNKTCPLDKKKTFTPLVNLLIYYPSFHHKLAIQIMAANFIDCAGFLSPSGHHKP